MTKTKDNNIPSPKQIHTMSELVNRFELAMRMGTQYGGDRNLYDALGYKKDLNYADYFAQFKRHDMAKAIINRPVKVTWRGALMMLESDDDKETRFEKEWKRLEKELKLKSKFARLDKLTGLGRYGVLLLGLDDARRNEDFQKPVEGVRKLMYVKPLGEDKAAIKKWETDPNSPRYGMPHMYEISSIDRGGKNITVLVHHSRVVHVVDDPVADEVYGTPRLEAVYNRLYDLEKLIGGSAEMFWRGAFPGYSGNIDPDYEMGDTEKQKLQEQISEFEHNLRRLLINKGVDLQTLATQVSDPSNHVDVQIQMISAVTSIPKRILVGSERGELASTEDQNQWLSFIQDRREEFVEPEIIHPFIKKCVEYKILPEPVEEYTVDWQDLFSVSDKDKAEVGKTRAQALKEYASQPLAESIVPAQAFFEFFLGLDTDQIQLIREYQEQAMLEEEEEEEESIIETPEEEEEIE